MEIFYKYKNLQLWDLDVATLIICYGTLRPNVIRPEDRIFLKKSPAVSTNL